jgi:hypothetical protein
MERWLELAGEKANQGMLIFGGTESFSHGRIQILPWKETSSAIDQ